MILLISAIGLTLITVLADAFIKKAALKYGFSGFGWLVSAALIYAATAFGWFFVMRKMKLSTAAVLYCLIIIITSVLISAFYFKERLSLPEIIGILMAITSIFLLARFA